MSVSVTFNSAHRISLASEFFMARRPVLDRQQKLVAHELLFCHIDADGDACLTAIDDGRPASASVLADVYRHGMSRIIGDLPALLYVDAEALMSDIFGFLPHDRVLFEIGNPSSVTPEILARIGELESAGFRFLLSVDDDATHAEALLPLVEGVRIDIAGKDRTRLASLCADFRAHGKKLLAERVETLEQYRMCVELGFDLMQGYFFMEPQVVADKKLSPSQRAITELIALVASDADTALIEQALKNDVALALNLLRAVNTPALSMHRLASLRQVVMVLGRNHLQRWLQIMLYTEREVHSSGVIPLLAQAATRGMLMELIAQKLKPGNLAIADTAFTVGIMSLMDTLFSMSMDDMLRQIPMTDEVSEALLHRQGYVGTLLSLVEHTEWQHKTESELLNLIRDIKLSHSDLYMLQLAAFEWSDKISASVC